MISSCAESVRAKISLEASFSEGFGILIKRDFLLKKVNPNPESKSGGSEEIYIVIDKEEKIMLLLDAPEEMRKKIENAFGKNVTLRITGVGYETIVASGFPGVSKSVKDDRNNDVMVPSGNGWFVEKVFKLWTFSLR